MMPGDAFGVLGAGQDLCSLLRARARNILLAANTLAGNQVESSRDDAFTDADACSIAIFTPKISREWRGDTPLQFTAKINLAVIGQVMFGETLRATETQADLLRVQMENALLCNPGFYAWPMERINSVNTSIEFPGDNDGHQALLTMILECQCVDMFWPIETTPLQVIGITVPNLSVPADNTVPADNLIGAVTNLVEGAS